MNPANPANPTNPMNPMNPITSKYRILSRRPASIKLENRTVCDITLDIQQKKSERIEMLASTSLYPVRTTPLSSNTSFSEDKSSLIDFPSYADFNDEGNTFLIKNSRAGQEKNEESHETRDDIAIWPHPSRHVDYLSHDWREEEIWATWKHLRSGRKVCNEVERLENASRRAWTKVMLKRKAVDPKTFDWNKDSDVTWLYGPFYGDSSAFAACQNNAHASHAKTTLKTKSIVKRPRLSEVLLRGSEYMEKVRSQSLEVKSIPITSDSGKKTVRFHEEVEQFAAIRKPYLEDGDCNDGFHYWKISYEPSFEYDRQYEEDPVEDLSTTNSLRRHVEQNIKILKDYHQQKMIEKLGSVPLKYHKDSPDSDLSDDGERTIVPSRAPYYNVPLCVSTLPKWMILGEGLDDEEEFDWLSPKSCTDWRPNVVLDIPGTTTNVNPLSTKLGVDERMNQDLKRVTWSDVLEIEPSPTDTDSSSEGSSFEDVTSEEGEYINICLVSEEGARPGKFRRTTDNVS